MTHFNLLRGKGWQSVAPEASGSERHGSIVVPEGLSFWRKLLLFSGPGYLVAVGYMDPGNWATDLLGGSSFGYALLSVVLLSSFSAMLLQYLAAKLGIATGRDLAELCRESLHPLAAVFLWLMAEIMIIACDLAEVIGTAVALKLLFGIPIIAGVCIAALDVFLLLLLQHKGLRFLEAIIIVLIATITVCLGIDVVWASPDWGGVLFGFLPPANFFGNSAMLYIATGIVGATVMPHNLYLHSALSQTRSYAETVGGKREAIRFSRIDSMLALTLAFAVNAAILILSAAVFYGHGLVVNDISVAYELMTPILGATLASVLFAVALLASGQNSTVTGTMAGQIIMEGFLAIKMTPWVRRALTRSFAIIPALLFILWFGSANITKLLVLSQIVLSVQLPFAMVPLIWFTGSRARMGAFVNSTLVNWVAWTIAIVIIGLNGWLVVSLL